MKYEKKLFEVFFLDFGRSSVELKRISKPANASNEHILELGKFQNKHTNRSIPKSVQFPNTVIY